MESLGISEKRFQHVDGSLPGIRKVYLIKWPVCVHACMCRRIGERPEAQAFCEISTVD